MHWLHEPVGFLSLCPPVSLLSLCPPVGHQSFCQPICLISLCPPVGLVSLCPPIGLISLCQSDSCPSARQSVSYPSARQSVSCSHGCSPFSKFLFILDSSNKFNSHYWTPIFVLLLHKDLISSTATGPYHRGLLPLLNIVKYDRYLKGHLFIFIFTMIVFPNWISLTSLNI